jgi:Zn-dependent protease
MSYAPPQSSQQQASGSPFDIKLRLFRIGLLITPSFWIWNAIWGAIIYFYIGGLQRVAPVYIYILIWVGVMLVSTLVHELGHAITARIFGQGTDILLSREGGGTVGEYPELSTWKRIVVIFMGPFAGFSFVALIVFFDPFTSNWNDLMDLWELHALKLNWCLVDKIDPLLRINRPTLYVLSLWLLLGINLFLNIFQLFPIIPTDGGMIFKEICCYISPNQGLKTAFAVSVLVGGAFTVMFLLIVLAKYRLIREMIPWPFIFPELSLISFAMLTYRCFGAYRELAMKDRHSMYREYYED